MKNALRFSCLFIFNIKVGRDIQVSSLHIELKKKNSHHQRVEVNKPGCVTPGGRGLRVVFVFTYAQSSVFQQEKEFVEKRKAIYYCDISRLPQLCLRTQTHLTGFPMCLCGFNFFLNFFLSFIYYFSLSSAGKVSQDFTDLKCAS